MIKFWIINNALTKIVESPDLLTVLEKFEFKRHFLHWLVINNGILE
jgi:hypothetical protein